MSTTLPGLAGLQTSASNIQTLLTTQNADIVALTSAVQAAVTALGSSEDPQVLAQVQLLNSALAGLQTNETAVEAQTAALSGAEAPPPTPAASVAK